MDVAKSQAAELNNLSRRLLDSAVHIHLSCGLSGTTAASGPNPMVYLEGLTDAPWRTAVSERSTCWSAASP